MSDPVYGARHLGRAVTALDLGPTVHVNTHPAQRPILAGAKRLTVQTLTSELAEIVSSLRVFSYPLRGQLERVATALMLNVQSSEWRYAERAALDLASLLVQGRKRCLLRGEPAVRGANAPLRIAELCSRETR